MKFQYLTILLFICFSSCSNDDFSDERNISEWTKDIMPSYSQQRYNLRLAFGKALAASLCEKEIRDYIKDKSEIEGEKIYNELLFEIIKNDKLPSGRTVSQVIKQYEDAEIKEIFGETLQDVLSTEDPLITIKIPDIFHQLDWNTSTTIPFVGVQTPQELSDKKFVFYYHNGYSELLSDNNSVHFDRIKYFYLMVKYSSDYIYLNVNKLANEKNISLYEFLPQIEFCNEKETALTAIIKSGIKNPLTPNNIYIHKMNSFKIWQDICGYKGKFVDKSNCNKICPRDCFTNEPLAKNVILTGFDIREELLIFTFGYFFIESGHSSFQMFSKNDPSFLRRLVIPSFRYANTNVYKLELDLKIDKLCADGARFDVPFIKNIVYASQEGKQNWMPINALLNDNVTNDDEYYFCITLLQYQDIIVSIDGAKSDICYNSNFNRPLSLNASEYASSGSSSYSWCNNVNSIYNWTTGFEFRY